ncbi:hypothetical protein [Pseudomonas sp. dw_358]|uniref:hypothetical protein n=1 Tax=Pseudomonas sp. dw_358 TaxID=2720083 RepID=UPI001BD52040|nr:hypothetical protein [Pseudomonas sp. dw_358]
MALIKCSECGGKLSTKANSCPHCGAVRIGESLEDQSVREAKERISHKRKVLFVIVVCVAFVVFVSTHPAKEPTDLEKAQDAIAADVAMERQKADDAACAKDLQCWAKKVEPDASYPCKKAIEKSTEFAFRWTGGLVDIGFQQIRWLDQSSGKITFIGDTIEVQNMYGAYEPRTYECDYDPATKSVIKTTLYHGRI